ncbi:S24 family peptidase [Sphingobacterium faecium]|jgi:repressor LexA|uniref:LexA family transcriptional regulator n=1 Tax=Sphingobacterium faecium TaxID=34087 RepID=UPI00320A869D
MHSIVTRIKEYLKEKDIAPSIAEREIGTSNGSLSKPFNANTTIKTDTLEKFLKKYSDINPEWLLSGNGGMLKTETITPIPELAIGIPLIPVEAFAGAALNEGYSLNFDSIDERYSVPLFDDKGVDFLMYVRGSSMYPRYNSGDVVACRFIRERLFIQWNKVYIIDSKSQGAMIKRLLPSNNPDQVICRSDNKDYIDFEVPLSDIQNIALVVGCISLD